MFTEGLFYQVQSLAGEKVCCCCWNSSEGGCYCCCPYCWHHDKHNWNAQNFNNTLKPLKPLNLNTARIPDIQNTDTSKTGPFLFFPVFVCFMFSSGDLKSGLFEDCISYGSVCKGLGNSYGPDHSKSRHFCLDFKQFWQNGGDLYRFQIPLEIQTICKVISFWPLQTQTCRGFRFPVNMSCFCWSKISVSIFHPQ